jgi:hypothetical protein
MNIVVCCKSVPGLVTDLKVGADGKSLQYKGQLLAINECDEYALEEALVLKKAHGGQVRDSMGGIKSRMSVLCSRQGADKGAGLHATIRGLRYSLGSGFETELISYWTELNRAIPSAASASRRRACLDCHLPTLSSASKCKTKTIIARRNSAAAVSLTEPNCLASGADGIQLTFVPPARRIAHASNWSACSGGEPFEAEPWRRKATAS